MIKKLTRTGTSNMPKGSSERERAFREAMAKVIEKYARLFKRLSE
jgi:hypothetical protein